MHNLTGKYEPQTERHSRDTCSLSLKATTISFSESIQPLLLPKKHPWQLRFATVKQEDEGEQEMIESE